MNECQHPQPEYLASDSTSSAGTIHWCPDCGAIRVVGQWATPKPGAGDMGDPQWRYPSRVMKPIDPSPTPWDFNTWGFYCDACEKFFDLVADGKVVMREGNTSTPYHNCGVEARYIGYDHSKAGERP